MSSPGSCGSDGCDSRDCSGGGSSSSSGGGSSSSGGSSSKITSDGGSSSGSASATMQFALDAVESARIRWHGERIAQAACTARCQTSMPQLQADWQSCAGMLCAIASRLEASVRSGKLSLCDITALTGPLLLQPKEPDQGDFVAASAANPRLAFVAGPLLQAAVAAGSGSKLRRQVISLACSLVKRAGQQQKADMTCMKRMSRASNETPCCTMEEVQLGAEAPLRHSADFRQWVGTLVVQAVGGHTRACLKHSAQQEQ